MPFSHHSHSGEFCGHATNTLEEMVQTAIARRMTVFALTEHMPREEADLYSDEIATGITPAKLTALFDAYHHEAVRLRDKYAGRIQILLGVEVDWIRASSRQWVDGLLATYRFDLFVGSVHHVHGIPIDYDAQSYVRARERAGGTDERLFEDYFDAQFDMVRALKPPVVGHFDLVRLMSDDVERSFALWPRVWRAVERNLEFIAGYGGLLELNSASLRKGMSEPYPKAEICQVSFLGGNTCQSVANREGVSWFKCPNESRQAFLKRGGRFTLSDDSHGIEQVGLNYEKVLEFVEGAGIEEVHFLERGGTALDHRFPNVSVSSASLVDLKRHAFWRVDRSNDEPAFDDRL